MPDRRQVQIDGELWTAACETAARRGETVTDVLVGALERYVHRHLPRKERL